MSTNKAYREAPMRAVLRKALPHAVNFRFLPPSLVRTDDLAGCRCHG